MINKNKCRVEKRWNKVVSVPFVAFKKKNCPKTIAPAIVTSSINWIIFGVLKKSIIGKTPISVAIKLFMNKICKKGSLSERTFIHKISIPMINAPARHR